MTTQFNVKQLLLDSRTEAMIKKDLEFEQSLKHKLLQVQPNEPVLSGKMLKKNKYLMKQERKFVLFLDGTIKYYKDDEQKGTIQLEKGRRMIKDGKSSATVPSTTKDFKLIQLADIGKEPKEERYSSLLDDWIEAINLVVSELK